MEDQDCAPSELEQAREEIAHLKAVIKGAEIALARDGNIDGAMKVLLASHVSWD